MRMHNVVDVNKLEVYYYYYFIMRCTVYNFCTIYLQFLKFKCLATFWEQEISNIKQGR